MTKNLFSAVAFLALAVNLSACTPAAESTPAQMPAKILVPSPDDQACLLAVTQKSQNPDVVLISSEFSQAATLVMVGVGPQKAPWKCLVSSGAVTEVTSMTDEGAL